MTQTNSSIAKISKNRVANNNVETAFLIRRWQKLCNDYLPVSFDDSFWRHSRKTLDGEPLQGWKLHISATILEACDLFEKVASFLVSQNVQFKAPKSLEELNKLNSGIFYGYWQIGKFITIYPAGDEQAVQLAEELHRLTSGFTPVSVPFDEQFCENSSVFYRYGAFSLMETEDEQGERVSAVRNASDKLVADDRLQAVPEWLSDPFQKGTRKTVNSFENTPLGTNYKIFRAITQRGKGGTYQAFDFSQNSSPRLCIVKEGRRHGEVGWNGQDGYDLLVNEAKVLKALGKKNKDLPQFIAEFEVFGNYYLAMEYVEGKSLFNLMKFRRRRFSVRQVLKFALEMSEIIEKIHRARWIWNDCKPSNIIVTKNKMLRPIDFEGAYRVNQTAPFEWQTQSFSKVWKEAAADGTKVDLYALGAVVYYLLTGRFYDAEKPVPISKLRRSVPKNLVELVEKILLDERLITSEITKMFRSLDETIN